MDDETWSQVIDTNLTSVFRFSRAAYPLMVDAGGGKIINIGSMYSLFGGSLTPNYGAAKADN